MGTFKSSQYFPTTVPDLAVVATDVESHFGNQGFDVNKEQSLSGWHVEISKGGMFKAVLGMRTALKIEIEPSAGGTQVKAGIGIWGQQAIPAAISLFLFWPVLITQIWGMVRSSKLDDEAIEVIGQSLAAHASTSNSATTAMEFGGTAGGRFCTGCGHSIPGSAKFCSECGAAVAAPHEFQRAL